MIYSGSGYDFLEFRIRVPTNFIYAYSKEKKIPGTGIYLIKVTFLKKQTHNLN